MVDKGANMTTLLQHQLKQIQQDENIRTQQRISHALRSTEKRLFTLFGSDSQNSSMLSKPGQDVLTIVNSVVMDIFLDISLEEQFNIFLQYLSGAKKLNNFPKFNENKRFEDIDCLLPEEFTKNHFWKKLKRELFKIKPQRNGGAGEALLTLVFADSQKPTNKHHDVQFSDLPKEVKAHGGSIAADPNNSSLRVIDDANQEVYGETQPNKGKTAIYVVDNDFERVKKFFDKLYKPQMPSDVYSSFIKEYKKTFNLPYNTKKQRKLLEDTRKFIIGKHVLLSNHEESNSPVDNYIILRYDEKSNRIVTILINDMKKLSIEDGFYFRVHNSRGTGTEARADGMVFPMVSL